jgi:hypothetical protein
MAKLTEDQKRRIVQELACFRTPSEVAAIVKEEYGVEPSRQQVREYNPRQVEVAPKWRELFDATRKAFLADQADIGIAQPSYRLRELQDWYLQAKKSKNGPLAKDLLEQAAKETGGAYTNKREHTGKDGKDLIPPPLNIIIEGRDGPATPPEAG